jgi:hypothetical protein
MTAIAAPHGPARPPDPGRAMTGSVPPPFPRRPRVSAGRG